MNAPGPSPDANPTPDNPPVTPTDPTMRRNTDKWVVDRMMDYLERDLKHRKNRFRGIIGIVLLIGSVYGLIAAKLFVPPGTPSNYVSLVRMNGEIGPDAKISAAKYIPAIKTAFEDKDARGVVIEINSPGGAPVQSALIHDRLISLRKQYPEKRLIVIGEDYMASGGYLIATGSETIYANRSTVTGSIGVISSSFGVDLNKYAEKFGIERRVFTAGDHKDRLDKFKPVKNEDVNKMQSVLGQMHNHFIAAVLETRADRLRGDKKELFSGDYWTGEQALALGLIDGLSDLSTVIKTEFNVEDVVDYTPKSSILDKISTFGITAPENTAMEALNALMSRPVEIRY